MNRLEFEPPTSCGQSNHLASYMSCETKFNKHHIREKGDSMKME